MTTAGFCISALPLGPKASATTVYLRGLCMRQVDVRNLADHLGGNMTLRDASLKMLSGETASHGPNGSAKSTRPREGCLNGHVCCGGALEHDAGGGTKEALTLYRHHHSDKHNTQGDHDNVG